MYGDLWDTDKAGRDKNVEKKRNIFVDGSYQPNACGLWGF